MLLTNHAKLFAWHLKSRRYNGISFGRAAPEEFRSMVRSANAQFGEG